MSEPTMKARDRLAALGESIRDSFAKNRRVMSFAEYLELVAAAPRLHLRSAPQYMVDAFDYFGSEPVEYPWGKTRRFKLFDCPWADGRDRLIGQELVQNRVYRAVKNFVRDGVANKLVLLHGPNGSAKSTLIRCIGRGLQHYSSTDEGALYRINWIFPAQRVAKTGIGFSGSPVDEVGLGDSYAYLPDELIDAKVVDELRDHPIFLIPAKERERMLAEASGEGEPSASDYIRFGRLSHKNRAIYEALLASYQGDYLKVLRHVQIERFYIRHRYRTGYVTVEPQLSVDANERQITADRSIAALPAALQSVSLFEYGGELVNANRGMIEYSDLLKRPLEAYKYLLTTVERSSVSLGNATLFLDLVFLGSSNEIHLSAFKEIAEFQSFRGRLELIRVPYLLDVNQEEQIYAAKIREAASGRHVAPHAAYVAALWAVLTRMRRPQSDRHKGALAELVGQLSPVDKAELYSNGKTQTALAAKAAKDLVAAVPDLYFESETYPNYEGRSGASPREMQVALMNAASSANFEYVSPEAILEEIIELTRQTSVYDFLKQESLPGGYHDHRKFVDVVRERYLDKLDDDVRGSLSLIEESEYERVFRRYIDHVTHFTRKEKVRNPATGASESPDLALMNEVEATLGVKTDPVEFRHDLIAKIGAWSLDHPGQKPDYLVVFANQLKKLKEAYFTRQKAIIARAIRDVLTVLVGDAGQLEAEARATAEAAVGQLYSGYGYTEASARDAVRLLVRSRYSA